MSNMLQSSQTQATQAPGFYTDYLSGLASAGQTAQQQAQFAGAQPLQTKAFEMVGQNLGAQQPTFQAGQNLLGQAAGQNITGAVTPYLQAATGAGTSPLSAMQPYAREAMCTSGYCAAVPLVGQGAGLSGLAAASPFLGRAAGSGGACASAGYINKATNLSAPCAATGYFQQAATSGGYNLANPMIQKAMGICATSSATPYLQQAAARGGLCAATGYLQQGVGEDVTGAAAPYLKAAATNDPSQMAASYMSPYIKNAVQTMSDIGQRNIRQNLSPAATAAAVGSGQFGSQRGAQVLGQIQAQAEQDLNSQIAQMLNTGYGQALSAAGQQQALLGQLGSTAGTLASQEAQQALTAGQTAGTLSQQQQNLLGQLGSTAGGLSAQQMQNILNAGNISGTLGQQQANLLGQIGSTAGNLTASQMQNLINAGNVQGTLTQQQQNLLGQLGQTAGGLTNQTAQNLISGGLGLGQQQTAANQIAAGLGQTAAGAQQAANTAQIQAGQTAGCAAAKQAAALYQAGLGMGTLGQQAANTNLACINALATLGGQQQTIAQNQQLFPLTTLSSLAGLLQGYQIPTSTKTTLCMSPLSGIAAVGTGLGGLLQTNKCGTNLLCTITGSKTFGNLACRAFTWLGCKLSGSNTSSSCDLCGPVWTASGGHIQAKADGGAIGCVSMVDGGAIPQGFCAPTCMTCTPYAARGGLIGATGCATTQHRGGLPYKG